MSNLNDEKILLLKNKIQQKKSELDKLNKKFTPLTSCSIEFEGERYNVHTLDKNKIIELTIKLNVLNKSALELGYENDYLISGFKMGDWLQDLKNKLEVISYKSKLKELKELESKLDNMLSDDKKIELELEEIENLI